MSLMCTNSISRSVFMISLTLSSSPAFNRVVSVTRTALLTPVLSSSSLWMLRAVHHFINIFSIIFLVHPSQSSFNDIAFREAEEMSDRPGIYNSW